MRDDKKLPAATPRKSAPPRGGWATSPTRWHLTLRSGRSHNHRGHRQRRAQPALLRNAQQDGRGAAPGGLQHHDPLHAAGRGAGRADDPHPPYPSRSTAFCISPTTTTAPTSITWSKTECPSSFWTAGFRASSRTACAATTSRAVTWRGGTDRARAQAVSVSLRRAGQQFPAGPAQGLSAGAGRGGRLRGQRARRALGGGQRGHDERAHGAAARAARTIRRSCLQR